LSKGSWPDRCSNQPIRTTWPFCSSTARDAARIPARRRARPRPRERTKGVR
jgi:hypothetical protein